MKSALVRILVVLLMIYVVWSVQQAFDRGDLKKATAALYAFQVPERHATLITLMAQEFGVSEDHVQCDLTIVSRYVGPISAVCHAEASAKVPATNAKEFNFNIDVLRFEPKAADAVTQTLFEKNDTTKAVL